MGAGGNSLLRRGESFMNQFKKIKISLLACAVVGVGALQAATQIGQSTATPADNFGASIAAKAFDRATGTMYVAVGADGADGCAFTVTDVAGEIHVLSVVLLTNILCKPDDIPAKVTDA